MAFIHTSPDTGQKLALLSKDSQYDLACACATADDEHRRRSKDDKWVYPVALPDGRTTYLFKTLLSNQCVNNCKYCPLRAGVDTERCSLSPEELSEAFLSYYRARRVSGLFLSSGVAKNPDATMERINEAAVRLRKKGFRGYIHLKIIPGASEGAITQSLSLASAVSLNIETAGESHFKALSTTKNYTKDILRPIEFISRLTAKGSRFSRVKQTTQFVVGASNEKDKEIVAYSQTMYRQLKMHRIYFSAYQRGLGTRDLFGERSNASNKDLLTREHRLYQVDWLMRKYGFCADEIPFGSDGNLSLERDPKEAWARLHPEFFPVNVNTADAGRLVRVPGIGAVMAERILTFRRNRAKIRSLDDLGKRTKLLAKAAGYVVF